MGKPCELKVAPKSKESTGWGICCGRTDVDAGSKVGIYGELALLVVSAVGVADVGIRVQRMGDLDQARVVVVDGFVRSEHSQVGGDFFDRIAGVVIDGFGLAGIGIASHTIV